MVDRRATAPPRADRKALFGGVEMRATAERSMGESREFTTASAAGLACSTAWLSLRRVPQLDGARREAVAEQSVDQAEVAPRR